jgi:hypothetical protein
MDSITGYLVDRHAWQCRRLHAVPSVESAANVADQKSVGLACFDQMQVLVASAPNQNDVIDGRIATDQRCHSDVVAIVDASGHRVSSRSHGHGFTFQRAFDCGTRPTHAWCSFEPGVNASGDPTQVTRPGFDEAFAFTTAFAFSTATCRLIVLE